MQILSIEELKNDINRLLESGALEISSEGNHVYIPYMMNDALECYLCFPDAQLTGQLLPDFHGNITAEFVPADSDSMSSKNALIFRQQETTESAANICTLWFSEIRKSVSCYRYDRIGHFWTPGAEHWRRLVYIIGTMYDKYTYMGDQYCNAKEKALLPLMEFAPFRRYSPISDSLDAWYADSDSGYLCMENLAAQAGDHRFVRLLRFCSALAVNPFFRQRINNFLARKLNHPDRIDLYQLIFHKVTEASAEYPERSYGADYDVWISSCRRQLTDRLISDGFSGDYPLFQKDNLQILAMEEHPFTILEAGNFSFRIQLMESETPDGDIRINAGFFRKKGNQNRIRKAVPAAE